MPVPQLTVEGRVVGDVQLRFTDEGMAVARFRMVAADRRQDPQSGTWRDTETFWITVTCFRKLAENVADSIRDRDAVVVVGKLSTSEWSADDGSTKSANKFIASTVGPSLFFLPRQSAAAPPAAGDRQRRPARDAELPARADDRDAWAPEPSPDDPVWTTAIGGRTITVEDDPWGPS